MPRAIWWRGSPTIPADDDGDPTADAPPGTDGHGVVLLRGAAFAAGGAVAEVEALVAQPCRVSGRALSRDSRAVLGHRGRGRSLTRLNDGAYHPDRWNHAMTRSLSDPSLVRRRAAGGVARAGHWLAPSRWPTSPRPKRRGASKQPQAGQGLHEPGPQARPDHAHAGRRARAPTAPARARQRAGAGRRPAPDAAGRRPARQRPAIRPTGAIASAPRATSSTGRRPSPTRCSRGSTR